MPLCVLALYRAPAVDVLDLQHAVFGGGDAPQHPVPQPEGEDERIVVDRTSRSRRIESGQLSRRVQAVGEVVGDGVVGPDLVAVPLLDGQAQRPRAPGEVVAGGLAAPAFAAS